MALVVLSSDLGEPVSLDAAKKHLRVEHDADDSLIRALLQVAREQCENETNLALTPATLRYTFDAWPRDGGPVSLPRSPLVEVTSVEFRTDATEWTTLAPERYVVDLDGGRIAPATFWPVTYGYAAPAVRVTFSAGYATPSAIPAVVQQACLLVLGDYYENRTDSVATELRPLPRGVEQLLRLVRIREHR